MKNDDLSPKHMDVYSRNQRLYTHLMEMGLFVEPVYDENDMRRMEGMVVAVAVPNVQILPLDQAAEILKNKAA